MKVNIHKLFGANLPSQLKTVYRPPKFIYYSGANPESWLSKPKLGVVGSRKASAYGREVTSRLVSDVARQGVVIISGLAYGIDSIAHQNAIRSGAVTVAVLPGPIEQIYPASHWQLAHQIIKSGGTLISEYPARADIRKENFIARNRIIAGLSDALLVPQAATRSGSLHTANFALEQGKTVMAVPSNIGIELHSGGNNLLKTGAIMITQADDIFEAMNIQKQTTSFKNLYKASLAERELYKLISEGISETEMLAASTGLSSSELSSSLSMLEIEGHIKALSGHWSIS